MEVILWLHFAFWWNNFLRCSATSRASNVACAAALNPINQLKLAVVRLRNLHRSSIRRLRTRQQLPRGQYHHQCTELYLGRCCPGLLRISARFLIFRRIAHTATACGVDGRFRCFFSHNCELLSIKHTRRYEMEEDFEEGRTRWVLNRLKATQAFK